MADFNVSLQQPQAAGAQPLAPVHRPADRYMDPMVGLAVGMTGIFLQNQKEKEAQQKKEQQEAVLGDFVREQTALSDAVAQGSMPKAQAAARARANFSKYSANYPGLIDEFNKSNKSLFEFTELGEVKAEADLIKDQRKQLLSDAQRAGVVIPAGASPELEDSMLNSFQASRRAQAEFEQLTKRNAEIRAQAGEDRSAQLFQQREQAVKGLTALGAAHLETSQVFVQDAIKKAKAGHVDEAMMDLRIHFTNIEGAIASLSATNPELSGAWKQLFADVRKIGEDGISGKLQGDALEQQIKNIKNRGTLAALSDPQVAGAYVASSMFQGNIPATFWDSNNAAKSAIALASQKLGGDIPVIVGDKSKEVPTFDIAKHNISMLRNNTAQEPDKTKAQVSNLVNNVLDQVGKSGSIEPDKLKNAANFLASTDYAYMVENGLINKDIADRAGRVFQAVYESGVSSAIDRKLQESLNFRSSNLNATYGELVNFSWNGAGVVVDRSQFDRKYKNQFESHDVDIFLAKMKPVNDAINQLVRIGAHREGNTNYAKFWEDNKHYILPNFYPDPQKLKVGQIVQGKDGKNYKYLGGNYNDIVGSYEVVRGNANE